ncbi:LysR family transcriptional regulator [Shewanella sp. CG12_big_fil_rev_8_21_14_0_65_47_15]|uniref:LysR family transcriptional regulator n=1 Tax=Shewanella sp. CG12_big_fil_rev_8_21_14_0_65_47_15 TaxID=1975537 RepID=UPI000CA666B0|nr:LysR family transcriptional regulator [Shewanella sp. CG12_big_fil_rev_8_21_14_0_65_47_15]PIW62334.1 MAG: LysR family transcriptional regulator [Shewanella sp. CG12_big_fil_rev_8_21_14_0_65_47_15]
MNLRALSYFVVVFEKGSISAAAKHCYIAQPSISAAISSLESELNTQLFQRHGKGVNPTDAGHRLYPLAKRLLNESKAIASLFSKPEIQVPFKLGLIRSLGVQRMSMLLKDFTNACPDMDLTLVEPTEDADARIITTSDLTTQESFLPLWHDTYLLAIPPSFSLSLQDTIRLEDLHQQPFIHRAPCEALTSLQQLLDMEGIKLQIRARIQTVEYAVGLVAAGLGIALIPAIPALLEQADIVFRPLHDIELKRTVGLAMPLGHSPTAQQKQLIELCKLNLSA